MQPHTVPSESGMTTLEDFRIRRRDQSLPVLQMAWPAAVQHSGRRMQEHFLPPSPDCLPPPPPSARRALLHRMHGVAVVVLAEHPMSVIQPLLEKGGSLQFLKCEAVSEICCPVALLLHKSRSWQCRRSPAANVFLERICKR